MNDCNFDVIPMLKWHIQVYNIKMTHPKFIDTYTWTLQMLYIRLAFEFLKFHISIPWPRDLLTVKRKLILCGVCVGPAWAGRQHSRRRASGGLRRPWASSGAPLSWDFAPYIVPRLHSCIDIEVHKALILKFYLALHSYIRVGIIVSIEQLMICTGYSGI